MTKLLSFQGSALLAIAIVGASPRPAEAQTQTKVACLGEASTHSAHRTYDPEYPELMGIYVDPTFKKDASPAHPLSGGMLFGTGTNYRIGNFGIPTGAVIETNLTDPQSIISSAQLTMAEAFAPHVVLLGPFGPHEPYTNLPLSNFLPDLRKLVARVMAFPSKPTVFVVMPLPRSGTDGDTGRRQIHNDTLQVVRETNLPTVDLWTAFLGKGTEFMDQNHLNLAGRTHMGQVMGDALKTWKASQTGAGGAGGGAAGGAGGATAGTGGRAGGASGTGGATASGGVTGSGGAVVGSGGAPGTGGATASGGATGSGGAAFSSGGAPGSGGAAVGSGGGPGASGSGGAIGGGADGSTTPPGITAEEPASCACATEGRGAGSGAGVLLALALVGVARRRRRGRAS